MNKDRENPYAAIPPLRGHTYVPWASTGIVLGTSTRVVYHLYMIFTELKDYGKLDRNQRYEQKQAKHMIGYCNLEATAITSPKQEVRA